MVRVSNNRLVRGIQNLSVGWHHHFESAVINSIKLSVCLPVYDFTWGKRLTYLDKWLNECNFTFFDFIGFEKAPGFFFVIFSVTTQLSLWMDTPPYLRSSYTPPFTCTALLYHTYDLWFIIYESQQTPSLKTEQTEKPEQRKINRLTDRSRATQKGMQTDRHRGRKLMDIKHKNKERQRDRYMYGWGMDAWMDG